MLIGSRTGWLPARAAIHAWSSQLYREVYTTDAVAGGISAEVAIGSAFSRHTPSGPQIAYLYLVPSPIPGTNSSHTPDPPSERIGYARPSQPLKSPVTRTPCAFGAQTANAAPDVWPTSRRCAPSTRHSSSCRPSPIRYRSNSPSVGRCRYGSSRTSSAEPEPEPEPESEPVPEPDPY